MRRLAKAQRVVGARRTTLATRHVEEALVGVVLLVEIAARVDARAACASDCFVSERVDSDSKRRQPRRRTRRPIIASTVRRVAVKLERHRLARRDRRAGARSDRLEEIGKCKARVAAAGSVANVAIVGVGDVEARRRNVCRLQNDTLSETETRACNRLTCNTSLLLVVVQPRGGQLEACVVPS